MFKTRLISGIVLVVLLLITGLLGGPVLYAGVLIIALIAVYEMLGVMQLKDSLIAKFAYVGTVLYYFMIYNTGAEYLDVFIIAYLMVILAVYVFTYPKYKTEQVLHTFFAVIYAAVLMSFIYLVRSGDDGIFLIWLIFLSSWGCDTCAYLTGVTCGKQVGFDHPALVCAVVCGVGGLISMVGDLAASAVKRNYGIKDYGKLIPGHGGILDRFDSVLFTAPVIYYLTTLFVL